MQCRCDSCSRHNIYCPASDSYIPEGILGHLIGFKLIMMESKLHTLDHFVCSVGVGTRLKHSFSSFLLIADAGSYAGLFELFIFKAVY